MATAVRLPSSNYDDLINQAAAQHGIDPVLFRKMLMAESGLDPSIANSRAGAIGVAQFMPGTAAALGIDPKDPQQAIPGAALYFRQLLNRFGGDTNKALAAYNWGPGNVSKQGMENMPPETRAYIARITGAEPGDLPGGNAGPMPNTMPSQLPPISPLTGPMTGPVAQPLPAGPATMPSQLPAMPQTADTAPGVIPTDPGGGLQTPDVGNRAALLALQQPKNNIGDVFEQAARRIRGNATTP